MFALTANPDWQRESPETFLGDHPVAHVPKPVLLARFAVGRNPFYRRHHALNAIAPIHADEPFINRAKHQLFFAAPTVWIHVWIFLAGYEHARSLQRGNNVVRHFIGVALRKLPEPLEKNGAVI